MNVSKGRLPVKGRRLATWAGSTTCYGCSLDKPCQLLPSYADCVIQTCPLPLYGCLLWQAYWLPPVSSRTVQSQVGPVFLAKASQNCNLRIAENENANTTKILEDTNKVTFGIEFSFGQDECGKNRRPGISGESCWRWGIQVWGWSLMKTTKDVDCWSNNSWLMIVGPVSWALWRWQPAEEEQQEEAAWSGWRFGFVPSGLLVTSSFSCSNYHLCLRCGWHSCMVIWFCTLWFVSNNVLFILTRLVVILIIFSSSSYSLLLAFMDSPLVLGCWLCQELFT